VLDPACGLYVEEVARRLRAVLEGDLIGVYVHGSATTGEFVPSRSDVDVLVVCSRRLADAEKATIGRELSERRVPCPGVGLELSVITQETATEPAGAPPFELHLTTAVDDRNVVDGAGHSGDPDLLAHFAMTRAGGIAITGPEPADVFGPVPRDALLRSFAGDLEWALEKGKHGYAVLNACRALRFLEEDVLCSKIEGGEWVRTRAGDARLVEAALARQRGADIAPDPEAARAFVRSIRAKLLAAAGDA